MLVVLLRSPFCLFCISLFAFFLQISIFCLLFMCPFQQLLSRRTARDILYEGSWRWSARTTTIRKVDFIASDFYDLIGTLCADFGEGVYFPFALRIFHFSLFLPLPSVSIVQRWTDGIFMILFVNNKHCLCSPAARENARCL